MKTGIRRLTAVFLALVLCVPAAAMADLTAEETVPSLPAEATGVRVKPQTKLISSGNPISAEFFCADPTAVEYNGRLYVYGTNDHQQYIEKGANAENTYERIKSLVVISTDDMVNWTYHGVISTSLIAPWIIASWAPSVISRVEEDGLTHFYLYFSNSGNGIGVLTATDPLGPWTDPLGHPLITPQTPGLTGCPQPFDPGAVIDENGVGWLSLGGGVAPGGTDEMPGTARIVRLGSDLLSFDSGFAEIPAPYFFEASELNVVGGTYVYTYCTNWKGRTPWDREEPLPSTACMAYMTTETPLDPESWVYRGECFRNPGMSGFEYSNNHTHMHKFKGQWYMIYHTMALKKLMRIQGGYRSLCVNPIEVDEAAAAIAVTGGTQRGIVESVAPVDAMREQDAAMRFDAAGLRAFGAGGPYSLEAGAWFGVRQAAFPEDAAPAALLTRVKGKGVIEVHADALNGETVARLAFDGSGVARAETLAEVTGVHDLYFVFADANLQLDAWQFVAE